MFRVPKMQAAGDHTKLGCRGKSTHDERRRNSRTLRRKNNIKQLGCDWTQQEKDEDPKNPCFNLHPARSAFSNGSSCID